VDDLDAVYVISGLDDFLAVLAGPSVYGNVADYEIVGDTNDVNRANVPAGTANGGGQLSECAGTTGKLDAQSQTVAGAGRTWHDRLA
jgi:hypothetical protein